MSRTVRWPLSDIAATRLVRLPNSRAPRIGASRVSPTMRLALATTLLLACGSTPETPEVPLRVAAAASLTDVVPALVRELSLGPVEVHFDASSTLARQIEAGDDVDVFLSADARWAEHLVREGFADEGSAVSFATNRLVVVVARETTDAPRTLAELAALEHVAVAGAEVPAGRLARAALEHEGVRARLEPRLVDAPNVRGALAWVARGEAEAAIVFATDALIEPAVRVAFDVPAGDHPPAIDVGLALRGGHTDSAQRFLDALRSPRGRAVLAAAGFGPPP